MAGSFTFDQINSTDMGVIVQGKEILNSAEADVEEYEVPGRDGSVFRSNGRRKNVRVLYHTLLKAPGPDDILRYTAALKRWLLARPADYLRLEDTYDPSHFRLAVPDGPLELDQTLPRYTEQEITFSCLPYRYCKSGEISLEIPSETEAVGGNYSITLNNLTGYDAKPILRIGLIGSNLAETIQVKIVSQAGTYTGELPSVSRDWQMVVLDCEKEMIYDGSGGVDHLTTIERFPVLRPGENRITVTGARVSSAEITPRWREL